ncbi:hypothetical protein BS17DRAFT_80367 [Gyrodon lividus]|nr:hypothetical protein BS17DRAFT_80367 [Gyrodon lividus]
MKEPCVRGAHAGLPTGPPSNQEIEMQASNMSIIRAKPLVVSISCAVVEILVGNRARRPWISQSPSRHCVGCKRLGNRAVVAGTTSQVGVKLKWFHLSFRRSMKGHNARLRVGRQMMLWTILHGELSEASSYSYRIEKYIYSFDSALISTKQKVPVTLRRKKASSATLSRCKLQVQRLAT